MNLTKAHVRFLEGRLLKLLSDAKKVKIENKDLPNFELLPEADIADMEAFLEEIQLVLPVIGADFLKRPAVQGAVSTEVDRHGSFSTGSDAEDRVNNVEIIFTLVNSAAGIKARAKEFGSEFVVLSGSVGSLKEKASFSEKQKVARDEAFETGRICKNGTANFIFEEDVSYSSPSAAAVFLFGTSRNGRTDWLVEGQNVNYGVWKDQMIKSKASS